MADNNTLITIDIPSLDHKTFSLSFNQSKSHTTWIDWGDNNHNQREIYDEVGIISLTHTYAEPGQYNIELIVVDEGTIDLISIGDDEGYHNMITQVIIGSAVTSIGERAFANCNNLEDLQFTEDCVPEIKPYAFANCGSLTTVTIPNGTNLLDGIFYNCSSLREITFSGGISTIWTNMFCGCPQLRTINIPEEFGIYEIADYAFQGCKKLKNIDFCKNVTKIGNSSFDSCTSLSKIEFTNIQSIGSNAFCNCTFLTNVNIPETIKTIGDGAFFNNNFLKKFKITATQPPTLESSNTFEGASDLTIEVPSNSLQNYINATNWAVYSDCIKEIV